MTDAQNWQRIPLEIFNKGRVDLIDEIFAAEYIEHLKVPPGFEGREGFRKYIPLLREAFPDFTFEIMHQVQDGDIHFGHLKGTGTMKNDFMGMPATGKAATWEETHIGRFANGKLVEHWGVQDQLGMFEQLGIISMPGR